MKILSWNCRGIGNPWTVNALRDRCWREMPEIVFLMETKIDARQLERVRSKCGFVNGICLSSNGRAGCMGLWWRDINVEVLSFSPHHIEAEVRGENGDGIWKAIGIYGWPETEEKHRTWALMEEVKARSALPTIMFGDFNEILGMSEKEGGVVRRERLIDDFRGAMDSCSVRDLGFKGSIFTWEHGNTMETLIRERLDRFMADDAWVSLFPCFEVLHFPIYRSDHAPIMLKCGTDNQRKRGEKPFRFEAMWLSSEACGRVVSHAWRGSRDENIVTRIANVAGHLTSWATETFGAIKKRIRDAEKRLKSFQDSKHDATVLMQCKNIAEELDDLHRLEESYWHARARANELRDGDKNTKYFHHKASQRRKRNRIVGLNDNNGEWRTKPEELDEIITTYFEGLFATSNPTGFEEALEGVERKVSEVMNGRLDKEPSGEEIREALFQMHPNKAPWPDGMHALFFQKFWGIVGGDIVSFVKAWWRG
ncbi:uncharacterized protein [Spinacia oleracea]|uniref:Endonuclease/exonuclease/phosphatase domain-containing protein n=1 Tax=Spinacia oleracea TaxID=3562 RepID=A0ABM3RSG5_SPIOL|nr:uncharacterized protein LOC130472134 [Spinacia oleracea]